MWRKRPRDFVLKSLGLLLRFLKALFLFLSSASSVRITEPLPHHFLLTYLKINEQRSCMIS